MARSNSNKRDDGLRARGAKKTHHDAGNDVTADTSPRPNKAKAGGRVAVPDEGTRLIPQSARAAFYMMLWLWMHASGIVRRGAQGWFWPLHASPLVLKAQEWCWAPPPLTMQDGAKSAVQAAVRALVPSGRCEGAVSVLGLLTSAALLGAALVNVCAQQRMHDTRLACLAPLPAAAVAFGLLVLDALHQSVYTADAQWLAVALCATAFAVDDPVTPSVQARRMCNDVASLGAAASFVGKATAGHGLPYAVSPALILASVRRWIVGDTLGWILTSDALRVRPPSAVSVGARLLEEGSPYFLSLSLATLLVDGAWMALLLLPAGQRERVAAAVSVAWTVLHVGAWADPGSVPSAIAFGCLIFPWAKQSTLLRKGGREPAGDLRARTLSAMRMLLIAGWVAATAANHAAWPLTVTPQYAQHRSSQWNSTCLTEAQAQQLAAETPAVSCLSAGWLGVDLSARTSILSNPRERCVVVRSMLHARQSPSLNMCVSAPRNSPLYRRQRRHGARPPRRADPLCGQ